MYYSDCSGLNNGAQIYLVLIPGTGKYYLIWKKVFADLIKLRLLTQRNYLGLSKWMLNVITSILNRGRQKKI